MAYPETQKNGRKWDHSGHSNLVRWLRDDFKFTKDSAPWNHKEQEVNVLTTPFDGYGVSVRFCTHKDFPHLVKVGSTNWRCEHEPSGVLHVDEARRLWTFLKKVGFVLETK